jgi:hypothetical protein
MTRRARPAPLPKWKIQEKYTVRIGLEQVEYLHRTAGEIMRTRTGEKPERITANSVLRTAIEVFRELNLDLKGQDIPTERELLRRALNAVAGK